MKIKINKREMYWWGIAFVIFLAMLIPTSKVVDTLYTNGLFQGLRLIYDYTLGFLPFPSVYLLLPLILIVSYRYIRKVNIFKNKLLCILYGLLKVSTILYLLFYLFWGLNYKGISIGRKMQLEKVAINSQQVFDEATMVMDKIIELRNELGVNNQALSKTSLPKNTERILRKSLEEILNNIKVPTLGRVRVRKLKPKGVLLRTATSGIYLPYVFEGHIDAGLFEAQHPFTMAHEMAHGYGVTDEGECNFMAILACIDSDNPYIVYSGLLSYWRYMANELLRNELPLGRKLLHQRSQGVVCDIEKIFENYRKYPDILPDFRDLLYDAYLKSNGISDGLKSYGRVTNYMFSWKETTLNRDIYNKLYE